MTEEIVDGVETPLGQHQRWMRQAPDLYAKYEAQLSGIAEARDHLTTIAVLSARANNASIKRRVLFYAKKALSALGERAFTW